MRAYYFDGTDEDQRLKHDSGRNVSLDTLEQLGVFPRTGQKLSHVDAIAKERGYKCRDQITVSKEGLGDLYESKIKSFFEEHLHEDEEIRWINEGSGFFDVRDAADKEWIRIFVEPEDLIVLPAGIYHRFTLDENNYIKATRLFQEQPKWTPLPRHVPSTDSNPHRAAYVSTIKQRVTAVH